MRERLRTALLCAFFVGATISLYAGVALCFFLPGGVHYGLADHIFPLFVPFCGRDSRLYNCAHDLTATETKFLVCVCDDFAATVVGAIITSIVVIRGNWFEFVRETLRGF